MRQLLLFLVMLLSTFSSAEENLPNTKNNRIDLEGIPSGIVGGVINVTSGKFVDSTVDLVVPGAEPIVLERYYIAVGVCTKKDIFRKRWILNNIGRLEYVPPSRNGVFIDELYEEDFIEAFKDEYFPEEPSFIIQDSSGFCAEYEQHGSSFRVSKEVLRNGVTNCSTGKISGRTNAANNLLKDYFKNPNKPILYTGSGGFQVFQRSNDKHTPRIFDLALERKPNGNLSEFKYDKYGRPTNLFTYNKHSQKLASLFIRYSHGDGLTATAEGGAQKVSYSYKKGPKIYEKLHSYNLTKVEQTGGWFENYTYDSYRLIRKELPEDHFLEVEYYGANQNAVGSANVYLNKNDVRIGKVKLLKAPVGVDTTPIVTHRFFYHLSECLHQDPYGEDIPSSGVTGVLNALDHKTNYSFDAQQRLTHIVNFEGPNPYSCESYNWQPEGNLISRTFGDAQGNIQCCRSLHYDASGNIIQEDLYGNLTGNNTQPVVIDANGFPLQNGCEHHQKNYIYSNDDFNLVTLETDGYKKTLYTYYPNTNLLKEQYLLTVDDQICLRQYFIYDENACLIAQVTDNGSVFDIDNQTGVTERYIKRLKNLNVYPIGLPEIIEENAFDFQAGCERRIHKVHNYYNCFGQVNRQDHYGSDDILAYSLFWEHDLAGNVVREINALGQATSYKYDLHKNKTYEQGPCLDYHKEFTYDFSNRLIKEEDIYENGTKLSKSYRYDYLGQCISSTDIHGNETEYKYDEHGNLIETHYPSICNEGGEVVSPVVKMQYNVMAHPIATIDAKGSITHKTFNIRGQPVSITYPDGSSESNIYKPNGLLERSIGKSKVQTVNHYDYAGRVICQETIGTDGVQLSKIHRTYNAFHLLSEIDALGNTTVYTYDYAGRLETVTKGNSKTTIQYDALGRIIRTSEYSNSNEYTASAYAYDALDRIIEERIEDEQGAVLNKARYGYDEKGNRNEIRTYGEAGEAITQFTFNAYQQPEIAIDAEGKITRTTFHYFHRNDLGQFVMAKEILDPIGRTSFMEHDALGRIVLVIDKDPFGQIVRKQTFRYDLSGNRTHACEEGRVTAWEYDTSSHLVACIEAQGTPSQKTTKNTYNTAGQLQDILKPDGTTMSHSYDDLGRLRRLMSSDHTIGYIYSYDANSNVVQVEDTSNHRLTIKSYDINNRLISETLGNGLTIKYAYDGQGRVIQLSLPDGSSADFAYDAAHLKQVSRKGLTHTYAFDLAGQLTSSTLPGKAGKIAYKYDRLGRLKEIDAPYFHEVIDTYDEVGRLLNLTVSDIHKTDQQNFAYDARDQLTQENGHAYSYDAHFNCIDQDGAIHSYNPLNQLLSDGTNAYTYDQNGNLIRQFDGAQEILYEYDALDRLTAVTNGDQRYTYSYDELNRRLTKLIYALQGNSWNEIERVHFLYQGQNEIGSYNKEYQPHELRILGIGKGAEIGAAVFIEIENDTYIPIHDHNGSVTALVSPNFELKEGIRYTAFGEEHCYLSANNPWHFSSKRIDPETGFVYFGRRYYSPKVHRWITADPIGYEDGPNLYAYVQNNPLTQFDEYGLYSDSELDRKPNPNRGTKFESGKDRQKNQEKLVNKITEMANTDYANPDCQVNEAIKLSIIAVEAAYYTSYYKVDVNSTRSCNYWTKNGEFNPHLIILAINGIVTSFGEMMSRSERVAYKIGMKICVTYNSSVNLVVDLGESVMNMFHIPTEIVELKRQAFKTCYNLLSPKGTMVDIAFSQGGLITRSAARTLKIEIRERIIAFGIGTLIYPDKMFKRSLTYISTYDAVPFIMNIPRYIAARLGFHKNVEFLKGKRPFLDHAYSSEPYQTAEDKIMTQIEKLKKIG